MKNLADETCERMVVASLIATPYTIFDVENILEERCFSNPVCRDIFNAVETVSKNGVAVDLVSVCHQLELSKSSVGIQALTEIVCMSPATADVRSRALLLRELSIRREIKKVALAIAAEIGSLDNDVHEVCDRNMELLNHVFDQQPNKVVNIGDAYSEVHDCMIENRDIPEGKIVGSPTGFDFIDCKGGLRPHIIKFLRLRGGFGRGIFASRRGSLAS